ncbi:DUF1778 domain-containing protein [Marinicella sediminis]|uniref:DUF1778 domain-containing protein n=1 Tax=Marinicella sediminis TaxID=1792834 RepID=A0ABV7J567_9GAMM|nr:DUF1778 domain-containing protein [Marinicella sediminis]
MKLTSINITTTEEIVDLLQKAAVFSNRSLSELIIESAINESINVINDIESIEISDEMANTILANMKESFKVNKLLKGIGSKYEAEVTSKKD